MKNLIAAFALLLAFGLVACSTPEPAPVEEAPVVEEVAPAPAVDTTVVDTAAAPAN